MPQALAAVFSTHAAATACSLELERHGFAGTWLAATHPARPERPSRNEISESSDGALGTVGRFFTGEGNSLRRSLEDHGLDPDEAAALDDALPASATVMVVDTEDRRAEALAIVLAHGATTLPRMAGPQISV